MRAANFQKGHAPHSHTLRRNGAFQEVGLSATENYDFRGSPGVPPLRRNENAPATLSRKEKPQHLAVAPAAKPNKNSPTLPRQAAHFFVHVAAPFTLPSLKRHRLRAATASIHKYTPNAPTCQQRGGGARGGRAPPKRKTGYLQYSGFRLLCQVFWRIEQKVTVFPGVLTGL